MRNPDVAAADTVVQDARMARLPQWAQQRIRSLESNLARAESNLAAALGQGENTGIEIDPYHNKDDAPIWLPRHVMVRYYFNDDKYIDVKMGERGQQERVMHIQGSDAIVVFPAAANLVHCRFEQRK